VSAWPHRQSNEHTVLDAGDLLLPHEWLATIAPADDTS
jgi:hypothetical protein